MRDAILIKNGEVYSNDVLKKAEVLTFERSIVSVQETIDIKGLESIGIQVRIIDAKGCLVLPGLIDGHQHYLGGSGEDGFKAQSAEITISEQISAGVTTSVGCLGVDICTRTMHALLGRSKVFNDESLSSYIYTGGYRVPPVTLTGSVDSDMVLCHEVIGAGELAISDKRSSHASAQEIARIVGQAYNGGILTRKAGVTHFHVGPGKSGISILHTLLNEYEINIESLYPTHLSRSEKLMKEGIEFCRLGGTIDLDVQDKDLLKWFKFFLENNGNPKMITASSDASIVRPITLFNQIRECILQGNLPLETVLPLVTTNTARILKMNKKARLEPGFDADVLVVEKNNFELRDVISLGRLMMQDNKISHKFHSEPEKDTL